MTKRQKLAFWTDHIQAQHLSGLNQQSYCRQQKLKPHQFGYWKRKLKLITRVTTTTTKVRRKGGFVPVSFAANDRTEALSIMLPDGMIFNGITEHNALLVQQLIGALK